MKIVKLWLVIVLALGAQGTAFGAAKTPDELGKELVNAVTGEEPVDKIKALVETHGINLNWQDSSLGRTALLCAVPRMDTDFYNQEIVRLLLNAEANVNVPDKYGKTPLHEAAEGLNPVFVDWLLKKGADVAAQAQVASGGTVVLKTPLEIVEDRAAGYGGEDAMKKAIPKLYPRYEKIKGLLAQSLAKSGAGVLSGSGSGSGSAAGAGLAPGAPSGPMPGSGAPALARVPKNASEGLLFALEDADNNPPTYDQIKGFLAAGADVNVHFTNTGVTVFHYAAVRNNVTPAMLQLLLDAPGANLKVKDQFGMTPLHLAVSYGSIEKVNRLLTKDKDLLEMKNNEDETPLFLVLERGAFEFVNALLKFGANINLQDGDGLTLLHKAAVRLNGQLISSLLLYGADISLVGTLYEQDMISGASTSAVLVSGTPKQFAEAAAADWGKNMSTLLDANQLQAKSEEHQKINALFEEVEVFDASLNKNDCDALGAKLCEFVKQDPPHKIFIERLIAFGANVNFKDTTGNAPLHSAAWWGHGDIVGRLLEAGADAGLQNGAGETPLVIAKNMNRLDVISVLTMPASKELLRVLANSGASPTKAAIEKLLDDGADSNFADVFNRTPLHYACAGNVDLEIVQLLLDRGASIGAVDKDMLTPLHVAAGFGTKEKVEALLKAGSDVKAVNLACQTPEDLAFINGKQDIVDLLKSQAALFHGAPLLSFSPGFGLSPSQQLHHALAYLTPTEQEIKAFIDAGADVDQIDTISSSGYPPSNKNAFHKAVKNPNLSLAVWQVLLDASKNAAVALAVQDADQQATPLHYAIYDFDPKNSEHVAIVNLLLSKGADVNAKAQGDLTPLHLAMIAKSGFAQLLITKGADKNAVAKLQNPSGTIDFQGTPEQLAGFISLQNLSQALEALKAKLVTLASELAGL
ncbi:ankyrin repeat domain-containing protein [Candidatus Babeliales bacterium]|nr:ankyrin repeat domain-containing protein [Candidatus Babeliales bacterium]